MISNKNPRSVGHWLRRFRPSLSRAASASRAQLPGAIEALEARIAPATLVSPTTVTYHDAAGDSVTLTISKGLLSHHNVNKVLQFDAGSVNGKNTQDQQLELINVTALGSQASRLNITLTITSESAETSGGSANVGYINATGIDLGKVTIPGDLGRIFAGDKNSATPGLANLTVDSMGTLGVTTQAHGGNLTSNILGELVSLNISGNLGDAIIGVGGGTKPADGQIGSIYVGGSIMGGADNYGGSIRATGNIGMVHVAGNIQGGAGMNSGHIGTSGQMGTVEVDGNITGDAGGFSGSILSTGNMGAVTIGGNIVGGTSMNSGEVGTAGNLLSFTEQGSITGGTQPLSGVVLSSGTMGAVQVVGGLQGGSGTSSGQIGATGNITSFTGGALSGGGGDYSGEVFTAGNIGKVTVASLTAGGGFDSGSVVAGGTMGTVIVNGNIQGAASLQAGSLVSGGKMGSVSANCIQGALISSGGMGDLTTTGFIHNTTVVSTGDIGNISAGTSYQGLQTSSVLVVSTGATSIFPINVQTSPVVGIDQSTFEAAGSIGTITSAAGGGIIFNSIRPLSEGVPSGVAIAGSAFDAGQNIGNITLSGSLTTSLFVAGNNLGPSFANDLSGTGDFSADSAAGFGFGGGNIGAASVSSIGTVTLNQAANSLALPSIQNTTFVSGIIGAGNDGNFGSTDDLTVSGSTMGAITAPGGLNHVAIEAGAIGATTVSGGGINSVTYLATDSNGQGIGDLNVGSAPSVSAYIVLQPISSPQGISSSSFTSNAAIGNVTSYSNGNAITGSVFVALGNIGNLSANTLDTSGESVGITNSAFNAGGNIGTVTATGNIDTSLFVAGVQLGGSIGNNLSNAGTPAFGFGSASSVNQTFNTSQIGAITLYDATESPAQITHTTFISGVNGTGSESVFGLGDDWANAGSTIGSITLDGGFDTVFIESGSIGAVTVAYGSISHAQLVANDSGGAGIGKIQVMDPNPNETAVNSSTFISNSSIGDLDLESNFGGYASNLSNFRAASGFGKMTLISTGAVDSDSFPITTTAVQSSIFTTGGNIGTVTITGGVAQSQFLAGVDLGADFSFFGGGANGDVYNSGASIGNVTVTGQFIGSDLVASVIPFSPVKITYGNVAPDQDVNVGSGGSIGTVALDTLDSEPQLLTKPWNNSGESNGIEAASIAGVTIGTSGIVSIPVISGGTEVHWGSSGPFTPSEDIAVREITA